MPTQAPSTPLNWPRCIAGIRPVDSAARDVDLAAMCGRFSLTQPREAVAQLFSATLAEGLEADAPRYNICPTQSIEAVCLGRKGGRVLAPLRWGFVPPWAKRLGEGPLLINARSETLAEKPAFRDAARNRRCLIPASGFFEWHGEGAEKQAWWVAPPDGGIVAFAGIWSLWRGPDGPVASAAIVTIDANETLAPIHHRMPLVIAPDDFALWLGEAGHGAARLMRRVPEAVFAARRVGAAVNSNRADGPELMAPLG
jgi:putative SOS response-associated peptidase YedK